MLIFSSPKPFTPLTEAVQLTAIRSWRQALPSSEIILFGNNKKVPLVCKAEKVGYGGTVETNQEGFEKISDMFQKAANLARSSDLIYLNSDILLDQTVDWVTRMLKKVAGSYLATARRRCISGWQGPPLSGSTLDSFLKCKKNSFRWGQACSLDIFLFRGISFDEMPSFCIGQAAWDNWLIFHARCKGIPVIDLSAELRPFHCDHDYSYSRDNPNPGVRSEKRDQENLDLLGGEARRFHMGHCDYHVCKGKIVRRRGFSSWLRELEFLRIHRPKKYFWIQPFRAACRPLIRFWEKNAAQKEDWSRNAPPYAASI